MKFPRCLYIFIIAASISTGCSEKPNMGSPVGKWRVFDAFVLFADDGSVVWHNDGQKFNPRFLAPLKENEPGFWKTDGHDLLITAKSADGSTVTQRYKYSVGTDGDGNPAIDISSPKDADNGSYVLTKQ